MFGIHFHSDQGGTNMIMSNYSRKKYQRLCDFIDGAIPAVPQDPKVYRAYLKWVKKGGYTTGDLHKKALQPFSGPKLVVRQLRGAFGKFNKNFPNQIYIDKDLVKKFEHAQCANAFGRRIMEASILHELIHLFDWKGDKKWMNVGTANSDSGANDFEKDAYGVVVTDSHKDWCT